MKPRAVLLAGPTASGKSALALVLAERLGGVIVNADSMQVYRELRVLTARPTPEEEALVPHRLYGVRPAAEPANAAWWRERALAAMDEASRAGKLPILCGGTGLYFHSLTRGLADVPAVPPWAREEARAQLASAGAAALHERLTRLDPATAATLRPSDGQRLARALEVVLGTGRGLAAWRSGGGAAAVPWRRWAVLLRPPRDELRRAVADRFDAMLRNGALDEVRAMVERRLDPCRVFRPPMPEPHARRSANGQECPVAHEGTDRARPIRSSLHSGCAGMRMRHRFPTPSTTLNSPSRRPMAWCRSSAHAQHSLSFERGLAIDGDVARPDRDAAGIDSGVDRGRETSSFTSSSHAPRSSVPAPAGHSVAAGW